MPIYIIRPRVGSDIAVEGVQLILHFKEGCSIPLITIVDSNRQEVAVVPSDAIEAVYQKDAEKKIE